MTPEQATQLLQKIDTILGFLGSYYNHMKAGAFLLTISVCLYLAIKFYKIFIKGILNRYVKFYI